MSEQETSKSNQAERIAPKAGGTHSEQTATGQPGPISQVSLLATSYHGPIAPPEVLQGYENLVPGSAARFFDLFESQARHRMEMESRALSNDNHRSWAGLLFGFIVALSAIISGAVAVVLGHDAAGATIATGSIVALVSVFVYGSRGQRMERIRKAEIMAGKE